MDRRVQTVLTSIDADLSQTLSMDALAKRVSLSSSRLRHIFAKEMGVPLHRYITASACLTWMTALVPVCH